MKTWIIIVTILALVLYLVAKGMANYISSDRTARTEYIITGGMSHLGIAHTLISLLFYLVIIADIALLLIYFL